MTDLAQLLVKAKVFAELWNAQDGCGAYVLDELAATINGYLRENPFLAQAAAAKASADARRGVAPDVVTIDDPVRDRLVEWDRSQPGGSAPRPPAPFVAFGKADLVELPDFHLQRAHVELQIDGTSRGDVLVTNRSTIELEVTQPDGTSVGLPPTARGMVHAGSSIRTPPRELDELTLGVTERELRWAQRQSFERVHTGQGADYLWITRLQDGRGLFLTQWSMGGVQLSIGRFGDLEWNDGWCYHPGHTDEGWRAVLAWDGRGEPKGWTRHPRTGRVRPDGTPSSEAVER